MNLRNHRVQEMNRLRATIQNQLRMTQTFDSANGQANGFRSTGFYQASRHVGTAAHVIGSRTNNSNLVGS
jgi:hypothetical protein